MAISNLRTRQKSRKSYARSNAAGPLGGHAADRFSSRQLLFSLNIAPYAMVIRMRSTPSTTSILSVRVNPDERAILEAAAAQSRTSLSDFMRRKALEAAETDVLNRTIITIPAKDWERFEAWLKRPARDIPKLRELGRMTPAWER